ncbi:GIY-YIG nuclease family protein [Croceivirga sp. JEA036]|uniref:GIY-YIG nuclease family protein n=1 Tax=Croceivirga sp. JEA036 TaxID=2721162 RepID=UPI00143A5949|nr:GIY-YIG nuclease family protein [Croceivirga sp. JEA036]NJB37840.1 GIY-YIG nuclease family protein [Croceivirga sp. JEA036]
MPKTSYVYIVTNRHKTTLYIGVTSNLSERLAQHQSAGLSETTSFAGKYKCFYLVYFEAFDSIDIAIRREKELKKWRREKKNDLITEFNPEWEFLNNQIV